MTGKSKFFGIDFKKLVDKALLLGTVMTTSISWSENFHLLMATGTGYTKKNFPASLILFYQNIKL